MDEDELEGRRTRGKGILEPLLLPGTERQVPSVTTRLLLAVPEGVERDEKSVAPLPGVSKGAPANEGLLCRVSTIEAVLPLEYPLFNFGHSGGSGAGSSHRPIYSMTRS
jgi:hypothetical protein